MDQDWSWKDLTVIAPVIASSFAFAYVVGYFYAFDIAWFPFFSLPEHLVFALRALPIAIAASGVCLIALSPSPIESLKWLQSKSRWFASGWHIVLLAVAVLAFTYNHFGLTTSFLLINFGAYIYHTLPGRPSASARLLYWATTLLVLCLMSGFVSGEFYKIHTPITVKPCMNVYGQPDNRSLPLAGHVIFAGTLWVLFYDYDSKEVHLIRREDVIEITETPKSKEAPKSKLDCTLEPLV